MENQQNRKQRKKVLKIDEARGPRDRRSCVITGTSRDYRLPSSITMQITEELPRLQSSPAHSPLETSLLALRHLEKLLLDHWPAGASGVSIDRHERAYQLPNDAGADAEGAVPTERAPAKPVHIWHGQQSSAVVWPQ